MFAQDSLRAENSFQAVLEARVFHFVKSSAVMSWTATPALP